MLDELIAQRIRWRTLTMTMKKTRRPLAPLGTLTLVAGLATSPTLLAQDQGAGAADEGVLESVVITAQRRDESLMDVPIPVSAISADAIEKQNVNSVEDVLANVPNVVPLAR